MNHDPIKILLNAYLDSEVTGPQKEAIEEHLRGCAECRETLEALRKVSKAVRSLERHKHTGTVAYRPKPAGTLRLAWLPLAAGLLVTAGVSFYAGLETRNFPVAFRSAKTRATRGVARAPSFDRLAKEAPREEAGLPAKGEGEGKIRGFPMTADSDERGPSAKPSAPPAAAPAPAAPAGTNNSYGRLMAPPQARPVEILFLATALPAEEEAAAKPAMEGARAESKSAGPEHEVEAQGAAAARFAPARARSEKNEAKAKEDRSVHPPVAIAVDPADYPLIKRILEQVFVVEETKDDAGAVRLLVKGVKAAAPSVATTPAAKAPASAMPSGKAQTSNQKPHQEGDKP